MSGTTQLRVTLSSITAGDGAIGDNGNAGDAQFIPRASSGLAGDNGQVNGNSVKAGGAARSCSGGTTISGRGGDGGQDVNGRGGDGGGGGNGGRGQTGGTGGPGGGGSGGPSACFAYAVAVNQVLVEPPCAQGEGGAAGDGGQGGAGGQGHCHDSP